MICPFCEHGNIYVEKNISNQVVYICDDCESLWLDKNCISLDNVIDLSEYLNSIELDYDETCQKLYKIFKDRGFKMEYLE